jgi:hypothetical protein
MVPQFKKTLRAEIMRPRKRMNLSLVLQRTSHVGNGPRGISSY